MGPLRIFEGRKLLRYEKYLKDKACFPYNRYSRLMSDLLTYPFEVIIPEDDSRLKEGAYLRHEFTGEDVDLNTVSVIEVLIAFAIRIDREYIGIPQEPHPEILLMEFFNNLKLLKYFNENYNEEEVKNIITKFVTRQYNFNGYGGIFPLKHTNIDQRKIQLWNQMTMYLSERNSGG